VTSHNSKTYVKLTMSLLFCVFTHYPDDGPEGQTHVACL